jgi:hypothetical protein
MEYLLTGIVIIIFALLLGFSGARGQSNSGATKTAVSSSVEVKSFKRSELEQKLIALSKNPAPKELAMGAMCYKPAMPPKSADYTCPKCSEKTLYIIETIENKNEAHQIIEDIRVTIPNCRRTLKTINGINISLDESQFCKKCSPDIQSPKLVLIITHEDGNKHTVTGVTNNDLILISEFLTGSDKHKDEGDFETPLKDHIKRLKELLCVEVELPENSDKEIK